MTCLKFLIFLNYDFVLGIIRCQLEKVIGQMGKSQLKPNTFIYPYKKNETIIVLMVSPYWRSNNANV